ncbi:MAG: metallophosphoesterase [Clostridia bacterium]|nr:metallophosphoesterase [Clostridia bacterium]
MSRRSKNTNNPFTAATKKKSRGKRALKVIAVILACIVLFVGVTTVITVIGLNATINAAKNFPDAGCKQISVENYGEGRWYIRSDEGLKVMQLTDVHIGGGWMSVKKDSMAINAVAAMITAEKPDFVVVSGDVAYPVPFQAGTFNNKSGAKVFAELMENLGVYWTMCFGNHDTEAYSYYSREDITKFYLEYPHCLLRAGDPGVDGCGNQVFSVINSDGVITRSIVTLDSHSYTDGDFLGIKWFYDNIHQNQIDWYANEVKRINEQNKSAVAALPEEKQEQYASLAENVPSSVFFHIPLTEYRDAWNEYVANGYADTENVKYCFGKTGEGGKVIYSGIHDDDLFETMLELGSTDSVFCGHDHLNNFSVLYKGIRLTYGMSVDYLAYPGIYKLGTQRGCTVIDISPLGEYDCRPENYYQDKYAYVSAGAKEEVTMQELTYPAETEVDE